MNKKTLGLIAGVLLSVTLGATTYAMTPAVSLEGTSWNLISYNETPAQGTLSFEDGKVNSKFCNGGSQTYTLSGDKIYGDSLKTTTLMYCGGLPMVLDETFVFDKDGATFALSGDDLTINIGQNTFVFNKTLETEKETLVDVLKKNTWNIVSYNNELVGVSGKIEFSEDTMYSKFCNNVAQGYSLSGDVLFASGVGRSTLMYCEGLPMILEAAFTLQNPATISTSGEKLTIVMGDNTFVFEKDDTLVVGGDIDEFGCKGSAGYSWSQSQQICVRVWESTGSDLEKSFDFAYLIGATSKTSVEEFRANNLVTRQEAAKLLSVYVDSLDIDVPASDACNVTFKDEASFDPTLKSYIYEACALGLMKGSAGNFMPKDYITKGQVLAIAMRLVHGWETEIDGKYRWSPYYEAARQLEYTPFATMDEGNQLVTRGELIQKMYELYTK